MTVHDLLSTAGIHATDAETMLAHVLRKNRAWLLAHNSDDVTDVDARTFEAFVRRRNAGEPVAYILGEREFYGRTFSVRQGVLIPRPCTESLVEATLMIIDGKNVDSVTDIDAGIVRAIALRHATHDVRTIVDVGTGSGCIAVSIACERPNVRCIAIDWSPDAIAVTRENASKHGVEDRIDIRHGRFLEPLRPNDGPFLIVTNPPYVTDAQLLANDVLMHEPREALMGGGKDGGDILREIIRQSRTFPACVGIVAECLAEQAGIVTDN